MPFGWVAAATVATGIYSSNQASKSSANATAAASNAANQELALSAESLAWYKDVYERERPNREKAENVALQAADQQLASMKTNDELAADYANYNKETFRPLEQGIVADAQDYDTTARRDSASAAAISSVGQQAEIARQSQTRSMARAGVNPSSGKMLAMQNQMGIAEAATKAGAGNQARTNVETQGYARKMDAANLGRNLASNQATSAGIAINAGNSATANAGVPVSMGINAANMVGNGYNSAISGTGSAASALAGMARDQNTGSGIYGAFGNLAGQYAGSTAGSAQLATMFSDVNMKENIEPVNPEKALESVTQTPVSNWAYKEGIKPSDGGQTHTGPMAQDVNKTMGEGAAPGGKKIDLISMNGMAMAAIQGLNKKVDKIMAMQGMPA